MSNSRPLVFIQTINDQQVSFNFNYAIFLGPLRLAILLFEVGAAIAAGFIPIDVDLFYAQPLPFIQVRNALLAITIIAGSFSILIYLISILNIVNVIRFVPWLLIFLIIDLLTLIAFLILASFACNQEALVPPTLYGTVYRRGLYATSGVLLYIASLIIIGHSCLVLLYLFRLDKFFSQTGPFDQTWRFNKNYCVALGWIRFIIIACLISALLASILVNVDSFELYDMPATFYKTRTASMILTATALFYSGYLFLVSLCNCVNFRFCLAAPWLLIGIFYDILFLIAMIIIGIFCAAKEIEIPWYDYNFVFRRGAYTVAALFEFLAAIFYVLHIILSIPYALRVGRLPKKILSRL